MKVDLSRTRRVVLIAMAILCSTVMALAQSYQGSVRGTVSDPSGAHMPDLTITLINESTKVARTAGTNNAGEYVFSAVEPGTYTLVVDAKGFKKYQQTSLQVAAQQFRTLDIGLQVASASGETVEVVAENEMIDNTTASNGQLIDNEKLENLPILGRNPFLFAKLSTNVAAVGDPRFNRFQDQSGSSQISLAGGPVRSNNYLIDGIPVTDLNNRAVIIPSLESTAEMKLQVNTYDAEVARTGGGVFNTVLKSGTNTLHGVLYGSTRQTEWAGHPYTYTKGAPYSAQFYSYAGAVGGPLWLPKIYNGKDKTFFWITEEGYRQRSPLSAKFYLPSTAERGGDFSATTLGAGSLDGTTCSSGTCIKDPLYGVVDDPSVTPYFAGNVIPANRINKIGQALMNLYPTLGSDAGLASTGVTTFEGNNTSGTDLLGDRADEFIGKLDHQYRTWWHASFSYMHYGSKEPGGNPLHSTPGYSGSYLLFRKVDAVAQHNTLVLSPSSLLTVGFGFNRFPNNTVDLSHGYDLTTLGFGSGFASGLQKDAIPALLFVSGTQNGTNNSGPGVFYSRSVMADYTKVAGAHNIKLGWDFRSISVDFTDLTYANGQLYFGTTYSGVDLADLLLGYPTTQSSSSSTSTIYSYSDKLQLNVRYNAVYVQDSYRITPKLTLNYGLRYEHEPGIRERNNQYVVGFNRSVSNPTTSLSNQSYAYDSAVGGVMYAGVNGNADHCCNLSRTKFAPRAGVAYSLDDKTVLRAGYGFYFAPPYYTTSSALAPGYSNTSYFTPTLPSDTDPDSAPLSNLFPSGLSKPVGNSNGIKTGQGSTISFLDQYRRYGIVQQYSADIERELPAKMAIKIGYVGAKGRNLQASTTGSVGYNINQLPDSAMKLYTKAELSSSCSAAMSYAPALCGAAVNPAKTTLNQALRPYQGFSTLTALGSPGKSFYNSLTIKLEKGTSFGLGFLSTYTWSSSWDSVYGTSSTVNSGVTAAQDANNLGAEYARSITDIPQRFTLGASYDLPFGKHRRYLNTSWLGDLAYGGWTINAVGSKQTGSPLSLQMNSNGISAIGASVQHPSWADGYDAAKASKSGRTQDRLSSYFNTAAFKNPATLSDGTTSDYYQYGNLSRTVAIYGPGLNSWDLSLFKTVKVAERYSFQFRAEALNAFNTPQFGAPNVKYGSAAFGQVTSQVNLPRYLQLGGRISF